MSISCAGVHSAVGIDGHQVSINKCVGVLFPVHGIDDPLLGISLTRVYSLTANDGKGIRVVDNAKLGRIVLWQVVLDHLLGTAVAGGAIRLGAKSPRGGLTLAEIYDGDGTASRSRGINGDGDNITSGGLHIFERCHALSAVLVVGLPGRDGLVQNAPGDTRLGHPS